MRISDWRSDVCSSDLQDLARQDDDGRYHLQAGDLLRRHQHDDQRGNQQLVGDRVEEAPERRDLLHVAGQVAIEIIGDAGQDVAAEGEPARSEEHTSELQSLMRISYAVFCLKKKKRHTRSTSIPNT